MPYFSSSILDLLESLMLNSVCSLMSADHAHFCYIQVLRNSEASSQNAFLAVYNTETTEILGFYQVIALPMTKKADTLNFFSFSSQTASDGWSFKTEFVRGAAAVGGAILGSFQGGPTVPFIHEFHLQLCKQLLCSWAVPEGERCMSRWQNRQLHAGRVIKHGLQFWTFQ